MRSGKRWVALVAVVASTMVGSARADPASPAPQEYPPPKRQVPDYGGRRRAPKTQPALWVPRVILSPLYFVN